MVNSDTVNLLKECDAGSKMAVSSIDDVMDNVSDFDLKMLLRESKEHHEKLGNEIHSLLNEYGAAEKDPSPVAKGMSWIKTNFKMSMNDSDAAIADVMTDGCNMGVKSLNKYLNQYENADDTAEGICKELVKIEEKLCRDMRKYL